MFDIEAFSVIEVRKELGRFLWQGRILRKKQEWSKSDPTGSLRERTPQEEKG